MLGSAASPDNAETVEVGLGTQVTGFALLIRQMELGPARRALSPLGALGQTVQRQLQRRTDDKQCAIRRERCP